MKKLTLPLSPHHYFFFRKIKAHIWEIFRNVICIWRKYQNYLTQDGKQKWKCKSLGSLYKRKIVSLLGTDTFLLQGFQMIMFSLKYVKCLSHKFQIVTTWWAPAWGRKKALLAFHVSYIKTPENSHLILFKFSKLWSTCLVICRLTGERQSLRDIHLVQPIT